MAYKSGNPALGKKTFSGLRAASGEKSMTLSGVAVKSFALLGLCFVGAAISWQLTGGSMNHGNFFIYMGIGMATAIIAGIITVIKKEWSPITAPIYAVAEGSILGFLSFVFEAAFPGIVLQAILLTIGIFVAMLLIYLLGIIKPTENFKLGLAAATLGIALFYFTTLIFGLFGVEVPLLASTSVWGILFTVGVIIIAALNLVVDFDFIEQGVEQKAPKYMEWYSGFGLLVTIIWLYIEMLRLLGKLRN